MMEHDHPWYKNVSVTKKLHNMKMRIKAWNKEVFGRIDEQKEFLKARVEEIGERIEREGNIPNLCMEEKVALCEPHTTLKREEK